MIYTAEYYEGLFNTLISETPEERIESIRDMDIKKYRYKLTASGNMLELDCYPIWKTSAKAKTKPFRESRPEQKNLNDRNRTRKMLQLLEANFISGVDTYNTFEYFEHERPANMREAHRDMSALIRRARRYVKIHGLPKLKFIYVTEIGERGAVHHHMVCNFTDRDKLEELWRKGKCPKTKRLLADENGFAALTEYLAKQNEKRTAESKYCKTYHYSLNLYKPWEHARVSDNKLTKRRAEKIALGRISPEEAFKDILAQGYELVGFPEAKTSPYVSGCYIYARFRKREDKHGKGKAHGKTKDGLPCRQDYRRPEF